MSSLSVDGVVGGACAYSWVIMHLVIISDFVGRTKKVGLSRGL